MIYFVAVCDAIGRNALFYKLSASGIWALRTLLDHTEPGVWYNESVTNSF